MPPALLTAAASSGPAATFMPASMIGTLRPKSSVMGVLMVISAIVKGCGVGRLWGVGVCVFLRRGKRGGSLTGNGCPNLHGPGRRRHLSET